MRVLVSLLTLMSLPALSAAQQPSRPPRPQQLTRPAEAPDAALVIETKNRGTTTRIVTRANGSLTNTRNRAIAAASFNAHSIIAWTAESREPKRTKEAAERDALEAAREQIAAYLRQYHPESQWMPSRQDLHNLVRNKPKIDEHVFELPVGTMYSARIDLELPPWVRDEMLRAVRLDVAQPRLWLLGKGFLVALALFGTLSAYFYLDDRTKGYYTGRLRLLAVVAILLLFGLVCSIYLMRSSATVFTPGSLGSP